MPEIVSPWFAHRELAGRLPGVVPDQLRERVCDQERRDSESKPVWEQPVNIAPSDDSEAQHLYQNILRSRFARD